MGSLNTTLHELCVVDDRHLRDALLIISYYNIDSDVEEGGSRSIYVGVSSTFRVRVVCGCSRCVRMFDVGLLLWLG